MLDVYQLRFLLQYQIISFGGSNAILCQDVDLANAAFCSCFE